jgi:hypothetical protein
MNKTNGFSSSAIISEIRDLKAKVIWFEIN